jgi:hypothetical protein
LKIFEIEFSGFEKVDAPVDVILPEGMDREHLHRHIDEKIYIGADYLYEALEIANDKIEEVFFIEQEHDFDITGIKELEGIGILNWPGEGGDCDCPFCTAERIAEEDVMKVECPNPKCKNVLRVADNGWEALSCPECKIEITRNSLCLMGKNYKVIHIADSK